MLLTVIHRVEDEGYNVLLSLTTGLFANPKRIEQI